MGTNNKRRLKVSSPTLAAIRKQILGASYMGGLAFLEEKKVCIYCLLVFK